MILMLFRRLLMHGQLMPSIPFSSSCFFTCFIILFDYYFFISINWQDCLFSVMLPFFFFFFFCFPFSFLVWEADSAY